MIAWFMASRVGRWLAIAGAVVLALVTFGAVQRRAGADMAKRKMRDADHENAEQIRERKDDALRRLDGDNRPVDDRLHDIGGFRD